MQILASVYFLNKVHDSEYELANTHHEVGGWTDEWWVTVSRFS